MHAPLAQRLAEIFVVLVEAGRRGRVEQAPEAQRGIQQEAGGVVTRGGQLALQAVVDQRGDGVEVGEEIAHAGADETRHHLHVGARGGTKDGAIQRVIDLERSAVESLPGIARVGFAIR